MVQIKAAGSPLSKASSLADGAAEGFNASPAKKYTPLSVDLTSPNQTTVQAASGDLNPAVSVPSVWPIHLWSTVVVFQTLMLSGGLCA